MLATRGFEQLAQLGLIPLMHNGVRKPTAKDRLLDIYKRLLLLNFVLLDPLVVENLIHNWLTSIHSD